MDSQRIEGLWDCMYCNQKGIKARYDTCTACGKPRGLENTFYLPTDIQAAVLSKEEAAQTSNEPDWLCEYCGSYNSANTNICEKCGAGVEESTKTYGTIHKLTGKLFGRKGQRKNGSTTYSRFIRLWTNS